MLFIPASYVALIFISKNITIDERYVKAIMYVYNAIQIAMNLHIMHQLLLLVEPNNVFRWNVVETNAIHDYAVLIYTINKFMDWFDTVFICLRNKSSQLSLLHTTHHVIMSLIWYIVTTQGYKMGPCFIMPLLNSFVHVLLYSYYLATSLDVKVSQYTKMTITRVQLTQFIICLYVGIKSCFVEHVNYSHFSSSGMILMSVYMLLLFGQLYVKQNKDDVKHKLYYVNLCCFAAIQIPVLLIGLLGYPFFGKRLVSSLYNLSLATLDNTFTRIKCLNQMPSGTNNILILVHHETSCDGHLRRFINRESVSVIKRSLLFIPFLGQVFWLLGFVTINRSSKDSISSVKETIVLALKKTHVQLFPTGTRVYNQTYANREIVVKRGSIDISVKNGTPIVVIYHNMGEKIDDKNCLFHWEKRIYAISSDVLVMPVEHLNKTYEERCEIMYNMVYNEFIRLEDIIKNNIVDGK